jgi:hypothetical protein
MEQPASLAVSECSEAVERCEEEIKKHLPKDKHGLLDDLSDAEGALNATSNAEHYTMGMKDGLAMARMVMVPESLPVLNEKVNCIA